MSCLFVIIRTWSVSVIVHKIDLLVCVDLMQSEKSESYCSDHYVNNNKRHIKRIKKAVENSRYAAAFFSFPRIWGTFIQYTVTGVDTLAFSEHKNCRNKCKYNKDQAKQHNALTAYDSEDKITEEYGRSVVQKMNYNGGKERSCGV